MRDHDHHDQVVGVEGDDVVTLEAMGGHISVTAQPTGIRSLGVSLRIVALPQATKGDTLQQGVPSRSRERVPQAKPESGSAAGYLVTSLVLSLRMSNMTVKEWEAVSKLIDRKKSDTISTT